MGGASSAEAAQQRRLILPDFDGRISVHAVKLMLKLITQHLLSGKFGSFRKWKVVGWVA